MSMKVSSLKSYSWAELSTQNSNSVLIEWADKTPSEEAAINAPVLNTPS